MFETESLACVVKNQIYAYPTGNPVFLAYAISTHRSQEVILHKAAMDIGRN